jgi:hypothetical protein
MKELDKALWSAAKRLGESGQLLGKFDSQVTYINESKIWRDWEIEGGDECLDVNIFRKLLGAGLKKSPGINFVSILFPFFFRILDLGNLVGYKGKHRVMKIYN